MIDSTGVEWPDEIWVHRSGETGRYVYSTKSIPPGAFYDNEFMYAMPQQVYFSFPSQIECLTEDDAERECVKWLTEKLAIRGLAHQGVKIPDWPIVVNKDLLQEIRDSLDAEASDGNKYCAELRDKLDSLYPYLSC